MTDIKQDPDGDIAIENGSPVIIDGGGDEVVQILRQRLRTGLGEWFLDTTIGVPYLQSIFKKNPSPVAIETAFKNEILNTPGVLELSEFELDVDASTRTMTLTFRVIGTDGPIDFSEVLSI